MNRGNAYYKIIMSKQKNTNNSRGFMSDSDDDDDLKLQNY